jgi:hypothetical protein
MEEAITGTAPEPLTSRTVPLHRGGRTELVAVFDHAEGLVLSQFQVSGGYELAAFAPCWTPSLTCAAPWSPSMRCAASAPTRTSSPAAGPTICSP